MYGNERYVFTSSRFRRLCKVLMELSWAVHIAGEGVGMRMP